VIPGSQLSNFMTEQNEHRAPGRSTRERDRLYLVEAVRFMEDACKSWRALAVHWTEAGDHDRASEAMANVQSCELQQRRLQAAIAELEDETARTDP